MRQNNILSLLGLAAKSRNLVSGEFMTEKAIKEGRAACVVVGTDASDNTKKNFTNMCEFYKVPMITYATKEELGHAIGKQMRASIAITDTGFADAINKKLKEA